MDVIPGISYVELSPPPPPPLPPKGSGASYTHMGTHSIAELQNHGRWDLETAPVGILWAELGWASCGGLVLCLDLLGLGTKCVRGWNAKLRLHATLGGSESFLCG